MLVTSGIRESGDCASSPWQFCYQVVYCSEMESETKFCWVCQCLLTSRYKNDHIVLSYEWGKCPLSLQAFQLALCLRDSLQGETIFFRAGLANLLVGSGDEVTGMRKSAESSKHLRVKYCSKGLGWAGQTLMLPSPSSLCLPPWQANKSGDKVFRQRIRRLYLALSQQTEKMADERLQRTILWGLDASFFYRTERGRRWGSKVKRPFILQNISSHGLPQGGDVLISSFLQPFTGGQGSLRQAIMYDYNNKSNKSKG